MTQDQEIHLARIKNIFRDLADTKYRVGQAEHGGNLFDMASQDLLDNAINEAIDQVVYLLTLKDKQSETLQNQAESMFKVDDATRNCCVYCFKPLNDSWVQATRGAYHMDCYDKYLKSHEA